MNIQHEYVCTNVREVNNIAKLSVYKLKSFWSGVYQRGFLCAFTVLLCQGVTKITCVYTGLFSKHKVDLRVFELVNQKHKSDSISCGFSLDF